MFLFPSLPLEINEYIDEFVAAAHKQDHKRGFSIVLDELLDQTYLINRFMHVADWSRIKRQSMRRNKWTGSPERLAFYDKGEKIYPTWILINDSRMSFLD